MFQPSDSWTSDAKEFTGTWHMVGSPASRESRISRPCDEQQVAAPGLGMLP